MDGNYEWQRIRANERVQSRYREADAHRQAKQGHDGSVVAISVKLAVPLLIGLTVVVWLLTG